MLRSVARCVSDGRLLGWVKRRLEMAVVEDDGKCASAARTGRARGRRRWPRFPRLLSNVYMRRVILGWKTLGHA